LSKYEKKIELAARNVERLQKRLKEAESPRQKKKILSRLRRAERKLDKFEKKMDKFKKSPLVPRPTSVIKALKKSQES
jgi:hypothetical protein